MRTLSIALVTAAALGLSACGTNQGDRAVSGGAIGAGAGALLGYAVGGIAVVPATIIGAAVGAAGGAITSPNDVDFGKPVWRSKE
jgi:hypothetical protein